MWYSNAKVDEEKQAELTKIIAKHLNKSDQEGLMRTIADKYIDEGIAQGMQIGEAKGKYKVAKNMYNAGSDIAFISKVTGLSISELNNLLKPKS